MTCPFRYVERSSDKSVNLYLFTTLNGTARADVKGPVSTPVFGRGKIFEMMICMPLAQAFTSAIRMANKNDIELVVSGDRSLWDPLWGNLDTGQASLA